MSPFEVVFSKKAKGQLAELYRYIARKNSWRAADTYLARVTSFCLSLGRSPHIGASRDDISQGLRTAGFERRITIVFRVEERRIVVIAIYYGGQNFESDLRKDR